MKEKETISKIKDKYELVEIFVLFNTDKELLSLICNRIIESREKVNQKGKKNLLEK